MKESAPRAGRDLALFGAYELRGQARLRVDVRAIMHFWLRYTLHLVCRI